MKRVHLYGFIAFIWAMYIIGVLGLLTFVAWLVRWVILSF